MPRGVAVAVAAAAAAGAACCASAASAPQARYSNVIFLLTDDQDQTLGGMTPLPALRKFAEEGGVTLSNAFVNTPVCCPSRAETLTGRYGHNLFTPDGGCMHMNVTSSFFKNGGVSAEFKRQNLPHTTAMIGKFLNSDNDFCGPNAGQWASYQWDHFAGLCTIDSFFNNTYNINGQESMVPGYMTAVLGNMTIEFLRNQSKSGAPFFLYLAPHAPHIADGVYPYITQVAPWYEDSPLNASAPRNPNYNFSATDHHWLIRQQPPMDPVTASWTDDLFRARWKSLWSVDDMVVAIQAELQRLGLADNTYFMFSSDHGYNLGTFRLPSGKFNTYENDIRVPTYARGPGIPAGSSLSEVVANIDLGPTILDLAGGDSGLAQFDGRSFAEEITGGLVRNSDPRPPRDHILIEYWGLGEVLRGAPTSPRCNPGEGSCACPGQCLLRLEDTNNNTYAGIRVVNTTDNLLYVEFYPTSAGFIGEPYFFELYNLTADPFQMTNLAVATPAPTNLLTQLQQQLHSLWTCQGHQCL